MFSRSEQVFLTTLRVGRLATADRSAVPHVVPVCYAISDSTLYVTIDEKPKQTVGQPLKRLRNIAENPAVAVLVDRYDEDWTLLGWVMVRGRAEILTGGAEHRAAQALLGSRYPQLEGMQIAHCPVIAVRIDRSISWGNLTVEESCKGVTAAAQPPA
jgi:PPOX class probable F420-dependent enzyme